MIGVSYEAAMAAVEPLGRKTAIGVSSFQK
jgi:hypothetical protein